MEIKAKQFLRECARSNLRKSGQPGRPCPPSQLQNAYPVPADQRPLPAHAIEMVIKLVGEEYRQRTFDAPIETGLSGDKRIEAAYRRGVQRDGWRPDRVLRVDDRTAETRLALALHDRHVAAGCDQKWIVAPSLARLPGETPSILQRLFHPFSSLRFRDSIDLRIAAQRGKPQCNI